MYTQRNLFRKKIIKSGEQDFHQAFENDFQTSVDQQKKSAEGMINARITGNKSLLKTLNASLEIYDETNHRDKENLTMFITTYLKDNNQLKLRLLFDFHKSQALFNSCWLEWIKDTCG